MATVWLKPTYTRWTVLREARSARNESNLKPSDANLSAREEQGTDGGREGVSESVAASIQCRQSDPNVLE